MKRRMILGDIRKSPFTTLMTGLFMVLCALLISLAVLLASRMSGAVDQLMEKAKSPHLLQMHAGSIDRERLAQFANDQADILESWQVQEFLNIDGGQFVFSGHTLADNMQDNGLSMQGENFDWLLDTDNQVITVSQGEVYLPLALFPADAPKVGETVTIAGVPLRIAGYLRDSQMNSTLAMSKRFLVHPEDFEKARDKGGVEYLISFRLHNLDDLSKLEAAYAGAGLESNGPQVSWGTFRMINTLSEGMLIGVLLLAGVLVMLASFTALRLVLLGQMETAYREIGVLKALGIPEKSVRQVFLAKYLALSLPAALLGFLGALMMQQPLMASTRLLTGGQDAGLAPLALALLSALLSVLVIAAYVNHVLKHIRKIPAARAVRYGFSEEKAGRGLSLRKRKAFPLPGFLALQDVLSRRKRYIALLVVFVLAFFLLTMPENLANTMRDRSFIRYMGIGDCDLLLNVRQSDDILSDAQHMYFALKEDSEVKQSTLLVAKALPLLEGEGGALQVVMGDHSVFPVSYSTGKAPEGRGEIALSQLLADDLKKKAGDTLSLELSGQPALFTISGVYPDVTNGGKTAKTSFTEDSAPLMWAMALASLNDPARVGQLVDSYAARFPFAKASSVSEYVTTLFGGTLKAVDAASRASSLMALALVILMSALFLYMLMARDSQETALQKALGFLTRMLRGQYLLRVFFVLIPSLLLGGLLAATLGQLLAGAVVGMFGAGNVQLRANPVDAFVFRPLLMSLCALLTVWLVTSGLRRFNISQSIKE